MTGQKRLAVLPDLTNFGRAYLFCEKHLPTNDPRDSWGIKIQWRWITPGPWMMGCHMCCRDQQPANATTGAMSMWERLEKLEAEAWAETMTAIPENLKEKAKKYEKAFKIGFACGFQAAFIAVRQQKQK